LGVIDAYCETDHGAGILGAYAGHSNGNALVLDNVFVTGTVIGSGGYTGGMFGTTGNIVAMTNCFSNVNVKGVNNVGGIIGRQRNDVNLIRVYVAGTVEGESPCLIINSDRTPTYYGENVIAFNTGCSNALADGIVLSDWSDKPVIATEETKANLIDAVKNWRGFSETKTVLGLPALDWQDGDYIDQYPFAGSGTEADPYLIATAEDLCNAYKLVDANGETWFKQTADIDMADYRDWHAICGNSGQYGEIIHYDGQYHVIKNFNPIDHQPETSDYYNCTTLFGLVSGEIINLGVVDAYCESSIGGGILGACAGYNRNRSTLKVENVFVTGSIIGSGDYTGGMFGTTGYNVGIYNCYVNVNVKGGSDVGGIIGKSKNSLFLLNVYAAGTVDGEDPCLLLNYDQGYASDGQNVIAFNSGSNKAIPEKNHWWSGEPIIATEETKASLIDEVKSWDGFSKTNMYKGFPALSWQEGDYIDLYPIAGSGTEADPYLITSAEDLCNAHNLMINGKTVYFKQTADIDMAEVTDYTELSNYDEISGLGAKSIYYDGGNHVIKNFTSTKSNPNSIFGYFSGTIKNLGIVNANVEEPTGLTLNQYIGILAKMSYASEGTNIIDNVFITGDLAVIDDSKYWVGPMCGYADGPLSITNSYVQVEFFTYQNNISGGLLGYANSNLNIANTYVATNSLCLNALVAHANKSNLTANDVVAFGSGNAFGFKVNDTDNFTYENSTALVVPMNDRGGIKIVQSWEAFNQKKFYNGLPALNWQDGEYVDHFYIFDKAEPASGSTFYQSNKLPAIIKTYWQNINSDIKVRRNAVLRNERNDSIVGLTLSQSDSDYSLINLQSLIPLGAINIPVGTYYIQIPKDSFTDESGVWSNEEVRLQYTIIPDPIYHFESANPPSGSTFYESLSLPSSIETQWQNIDEPIVVRRNAVLCNENNDSIVGLTVSQSPADKSLIYVRPLIPLASIKVPVGTYYVRIPKDTFSDESGVW
ncbi:MAG: hypothetical protein K2K94_08465, partial [Muribaculaceae bacterium]|nr:hypothetical protein [Muribaculaceae bacterium]